MFRTLRLSAVLLVAACSLVAIMGRGTRRENPARSGAAPPPGRHDRRVGNGPVPVGNLALHFEANWGQTDRRVRFLSRGSGYSLFLTPTETVIALQKGSGFQPSLASRIGVQGSEGSRRTPNTEHRTPTVLRMRLAGANVTPQVTGEAPLPGKVNYFRGDDPKQWQTGVPTYAKVRYRGVYPGIDLVYYGSQRQLEYDFVVAPGTDPTRITLAFDGLVGAGPPPLRIAENGDLVLETAGGAVRWKRPVVYQKVHGAHRPVAGGYVLKGRSRVGFAVARYDSTKPLVIDPVFVYSTYFGGSSFDGCAGIAADSAGHVYVTGETFSTDFPLAIPFQNTHGNSLVNPGGTDAFIAKFDTSQSGAASLVYSTYLGGSGDDEGNAIAVNSAGDVFVTGVTDSTNFPTKSSRAYAGGRDVFVTKLRADGQALLYSTYIGGTGDDVGNAIAINGSGNAFVTGFTLSNDFPTTASALQPTPGSAQDAFVVKLSSGGSISFSTYLGGNGDDAGLGIAVDGANKVYVAGFTFSSNLPVTNGGMLRGIADAFVAKLNANGRTLAYMTYLGGRDSDDARAIAVDADGNAYVTGSTSSNDFPTANAFQPLKGSDFDAFVSKLNPTATGLVYSTYLGGSENESGHGIALDAARSATVTGETSSRNFPTRNAIQPQRGGSSRNRDGFVTRLTPAGNDLVYSTYLGGSDVDFGTGIALDGMGNAYVTGITSSDDFPVRNAFQPNRHTFADGFVTKVPDNRPPDAKDDALAINDMTSVNIPVLANDVDPDDDLLTVTGVTRPARGSVSINPDGTAIRYSVSPYLSGVTTFTYTISDGFGGTDTAAVALTGCAEDVSAQVRVTQGGYRLNVATGKWQQDVTLKNVGGRLKLRGGGLFLALDDLSANATLVNKTGDTVCTSPKGKPYIGVFVGTDGLFSAGERAVVRLLFTRNNTEPITFRTTRVLLTPGPP